MNQCCLGQVCKSAYWVNACWVNIPNEARPTDSRGEVWHVESGTLYMGPCNPAFVDRNKLLSVGWTWRFWAETTDWKLSIGRCSMVVVALTSALGALIVTSICPLLVSGPDERTAVWRQGSCFGLECLIFHELDNHPGKEMFGHQDSTDGLLLSPCIWWICLGPTVTQREALLVVVAMNQTLPVLRMPHENKYHANQGQHTNLQSLGKGQWQQGRHLSICVCD